MFRRTISTRTPNTGWGELKGPWFDTQLSNHNQDLVRGSSSVSPSVAGSGWTTLDSLQGSFQNE